MTPVGGVILFSFCLRLQNQTLTTSFSNWRDSAKAEISWAEGLGCLWKWVSRAPLTDTSILVLFFLFLPWAAILSMEVGDPVVESASSNHFANKGFNLHIFLKLSWRASNLQMVVWLKTFPYKVPRASPTSAWVKPSLIRLCLNCLANCSRSSEEGASSSPDPGSPGWRWWWRRWSGWWWEWLLFRLVSRSWWSDMTEDKEEESPDPAPDPVPPPPEEDDPLIAGWSTWCPFPGPANIPFMEYAGWCCRGDEPLEWGEAWWPPIPAIDMDDGCHGGDGMWEGGGRWWAWRWAERSVCPEGLMSCKECILAAEAHGFVEWWWSLPWDRPVIEAHWWWADRTEAVCPFGVCWWGWWGMYLSSTGVSLPTYPWDISWWWGWWWWWLERWLWRLEFKYGLDAPDAIRPKFHSMEGDSIPFKGGEGCREEESLSGISSQSTQSVNQTNLFHTLRKPRDWLIGVYDDEQDERVRVASINYFTPDKNSWFWLKTRNREQDSMMALILLSVFMMRVEMVM